MLTTARIAVALASLSAMSFAAAPQDGRPGDADLTLGAKEHRYRWERQWLKLPEGVELGNTHGGIAFDSAGRVYFNTDTTRAVIVVDPSGEFIGSWGRELAGGLHGMTLVEEKGEEVIYLAHAPRGKVFRVKLDGTVVATIGVPEEAGIYGEGVAYRPTSVAVAPDGGLFVADGYGASWIHRYDAEHDYVRSFGGPGTEPGKLRTPHGICVDTRGDEARLVVADRENGRLQVFSLEGKPLAVYADDVRRPCSVAIQGEYAVVADLDGRVTILDEDFALVAHLGDNPDTSQWANNGVLPTDWRDGIFLAPHSAAWDAEGNLYVMDWNRHGRMTKLARLP